MNFLFFGQILSPVQGFLETALSCALRSRGHAVVHIHCGPKAFGICDVFNASTAPGVRETYCAAQCTERYETLIKAHGLPVDKVSNFWNVEEADRALLWAAELSGVPDLASVAYRGYPLFEVAKWSAVRYLQRLETFDPNGAHRWIAVESMKNSRVTIDALENILGHARFDAIVLWNGLNFSQRAALEVAKKKGIDYYCFELGLNKNTCLISKNRPVVPIDLGVEWQHWKDVPLTASESDWLSRYMRSRERQEDMTLPCKFDNALDREKLAASLKISPEKKIVPLFTNLTYDTSLEKAHFPFDTQLRWIEHTAKIFARHPDHVAVVRIHPLEILDGKFDTREPVFDRASKLALPENVRIVGPESSLDSYSLMRHAAFGIPYVSTTGLELAYRGMPVISAGVAPYKGKGFTWDPQSIEDYTRLVESMMSRPHMPEQGQEKAARYAYLYFRRACLKMDFLGETQSGLVKPMWNSLSELGPGKFPALDHIAETLLGQRPFVRPPHESARYSASI